MEFITKIFRNKANNQRSIVIPRGCNKLKIDKLPDLVRVKISIPKDYLGKVNKK